MKKDFIKLVAKTDQEKKMLLNIITPKTSEEMKEIRDKNTKVWIENNKNYPEGYFDNFENNDDYVDYDQVQPLSVYLYQNVIVETTFDGLYGNFLYKIKPRCGFEKVPHRDLKNTDPRDEYIDEYFEIEFVVSRKDKTAEEIKEIVKNSKYDWEIEYQAKPKLIIKDISFNIHKQSSFIFSDLLSSFVNEVRKFQYYSRKDVIRTPSTQERQHFPYDLDKAYKLAYFYLDQCFHQKMDDENKFIKELIAA